MHPNPERSLSDPSGRISAVESARRSLQLGRLLGRKVRLWFYIALAFLLLIAADTALDFVVLHNAGNWVKDTQRALSDVWSLRSALAETQSARLGFLLTGDQAFLQRYREARATIDRALDDLARIGDGDAAAQTRLRQMGQQLRSEIAELERTTDPLRRQDLTDRIRSRSHALQEEQYALLAGRVITRQRLLFAVLALVLAGVVLGLVFLASTRRQFRSLLSEQRMAEEEFFEAGLRYAVLGECLPAILIATNPEGVCTYVNQTYEDYTGIPLTNVKGSVWDPPVHPEEAAAVRDLWTGCLRKFELCDLQYRLRRRDGTFRWHSMRAVPVPHSEGGWMGWFGVCTDIDDQKLAEYALRHKARIVELSHDAIMIARPDGTVTDWSAGAEEVYGIPRDAAVGRRLHSLLQTDPARWAEIDETLARTGYWDGELTHRRADGTVIEVESRQALVRNADGETLGILEINRDITERKLAEAALRDSRQTLQLAVDAAGMGTWSVDLETGVVTAGRVAAGLFPPESRGRVVEDWLAGIAPEDRERVRAAFGAVTEIGGEYEVEARVAHPDGIRWILSKGRVVGPPRRMIGVVQDVTDRKLAEESLRAAAAEMAATLDAVPAAIYIARDPDARHITGNRMAYELLGVPCGGNLSKTAPEGTPKGEWNFMRDGVMIPPEDLPVQVVARTGQPLRDVEFDLVLPDGTSRRLFGNAVPLLDDQGRPTGSVAALLDVSERKRAEERLREIHKLESIGVLAGGIAHEFNNILTTIMGNASIVLDRTSTPENVQAILSSAGRAAELTRHLLAYAGKGRFVMGKVRVSDTIAGMSELLRVSVPRNIEVKLALQPDTFVVVSDASQIQQMVLNLTSNAAEAIGETQPGEIRISSGCRQITETIQTRLGPLGAGDYVFIEVADTGCGMDDETLIRIFDPFFSTKFTGRGLGLAAVAGMVRGIKGGILVKSAPGGGSTFTIVLPAVPSGDALHEPDQPREGTLLVVESEAAVSTFVESTLRSAGYQVLIARNRQEAVSAVRRGRVSLALLDLLAPGMADPDAIAELRRLRPHLKILLTGGSAESPTFASAGPPNGVVFLDKPYTVGRLLDAVQAALVGGEPHHPTLRAGRPCR